MTLTTVDDELVRWCERWLGAPPVADIFRSRKISDVRGVRLADGREVVVKVRDASARVAACVRVQRHLWRAGFPCAEPLTDAAPFGRQIASAERYVPGGTALARGIDGARRYAEELARAVSLAPAPAAAGSLEPPPYWLGWEHAEPGIWPADPDVDLNSRQGPEWIDDAGRRARTRLGGARREEDVVVHADWESQNLRWTGDQLLVAHDWDSAVARPEASVVGVASLIFPSTGTTNEPATLEESHAFLDAYEAARGRAFTREQRELAWAGSVWIGAWKAKKATYYTDAGVVFTEFAPQVQERLRLAGG